MENHIIKQYCGLALIQLAIDELGIGGTYVCFDIYAKKVKATGSRSECEDYYDAYVQRISERGD